MADKKMNDFATATDGAYIYAESSSGEQIKISKADLASVVAGLILKGQPLKEYTYPNDVDSIRTFSIAMVNNNWAGNPLSNYGKYGILLTIGCQYDGRLELMAMQILLPAIGTATPYIRTCWNGTWLEWVSI